jgi:pimeloyl-ACP methyl ester carboxylesterase
VLVNGAWANNASWSRVIKHLQSDGYTVVAPPTPLQTLIGDAETIGDLLQTIRGPIVLVGHSYGGMVISNAATGNPNVKALVYINAFIPDEGESALGLDSSKPGSALGAGPPNTVFNFVPFPGAAQGDALLYVKPSVFLQGFANDLPAKEGAVLEATQGPAVFSALTAPSGPPAWKTIPSWDLVGTIDNAIPSSIQLFMANRAHAHITEVKAGHLSMISQPDAVTKVIEEAARSSAGQNGSHPQSVYGDAHRTEWASPFLRTLRRAGKRRSPDGNKGSEHLDPSLTSCSSRARSPARSGRYEGPRFSSFGSPTDVVELAEIEPDDPGRGQLAVAIEAAPINPSDLMLIKGIYGVNPELPAALGAEGVGRVIAVGDGVDSSRIGERVPVVPTLEQATWRQQTVIDERNGVPVDADGEPLQLTMLGINPVTAYCLLHGYAKLARGT